MSRAAAPLLESGGRGAIVNISSIHRALGSPADLPYSTAKGGVETLTRAPAKGLAPKIRVNAVAPGNVLTDMTSEAGSAVVERFNRETPLKRSAQPDEIASVVAFQASDEASFLTGQVITVDGGYSLP